MSYSEFGELAINCRDNPELNPKEWYLARFMRIYFLVCADSLQNPNPQSLKTKALKKLFDSCGNDCLDAGVSQEEMERIVEFLDKVYSQKLEAKPLQMLN